MPPYHLKCSEPAPYMHNSEIHSQNLQDQACFAMGRLTAAYAGDWQTKLSHKCNKISDKTMQAGGVSNAFSTKQLSSKVWCRCSVTLLWLLHEVLYRSLWPMLPRHLPCLVLHLLA